MSPISELCTLLEVRHLNKVYDDDDDDIRQKKMWNLNTQDNRTDGKVLILLKCPHVSALFPRIP